MPRIENQISLGNILTIVGLVVAISVAWGAFKAELAQASVIIQDHEERLRVLEDEVIRGLARIDARLSALEAKP